MATTFDRGAFFEIAQTSNIIRKWQRSSKMEFIDGVMTLPADTAAVYYRFASEADLTQYHGLVSSGSGDGARGRVLYNPADGSMSLVADDRPRYQVAVDKNFVVVGGGDSLTMTWRRLLPGGTVDTGFADTIVVEIGERLFRLVFVAGEATQAFSPTLSARFSIVGTANYKITNPLTFTAVE